MPPDAAAAEPLTQIGRLISIMARLRGPGGCPWDHKQTLETLRPYLIEEAYEVLDALASGDPEKHCEELGDLLLQVVFHSQITSESGGFDFEDVARSISDKLVRRHPHVFGELHVDDADEVIRNWEVIKQQERKDSGGPESMLSGVPRHLPALMRAQEVQKRAARVGFDWEHEGQVLDKVQEEILELREALESGDDRAASEEFGDLLFALVNFARRRRYRAEEVMHEAVAKFERRFQEVERRVRESGREMADCGLVALDQIWDEVKAGEAVADAPPSA